jgi:hypothetical protein
MALQPTSAAERPSPVSQGVMKDRKMLKKFAIFLNLFSATIIFATIGLAKDIETLNESLMRKIARGEKDDVSGLTYPIHFKFVLGTKDGGTIFILLRGLEGKEYGISFDHRINTKTDGRIYTGTNFNDDHKKLIDINSATEKRVLNLLQEIVSTNLSSEQQMKLKDKETWEGIEDLPMEDAKATIVLREIHQYKKTYCNPNN